MISGFMVVKDVVKQGYPFVEAVASVLPICDEFLISEGYSSDETFEVVQKMAKLNKKIKIFRQKWPSAQNWNVIGKMTNSLREKCKYDYILSIQANEIFHEDSLEFIKYLPKMCPNVNTFSFPFWHMVGNRKFLEEFRLRFSKNLQSIIATGDAWTLGVSKAFVVSKAFASIWTPRKLLRYIGRGIQWTYANSGGNLISRAIYLPKPVFRYWSLFPKNHLEKMRRHAEMFNLNLEEAIGELSKHVDNPAYFWRTAQKMAINNPLGFNYPDDMGLVDKKDHPRIIQDFVVNHESDRYYVRKEIMELIRENNA
jgi:hypothetical protein